MKNGRWLWVGVAVFLSLKSVWADPADYYPSGSTSQTGSATGHHAAPVPFMVSPPKLRSQGTGWDVGAYGGIAPFENGDLDISSPYAPDVSLKARTKSRVGGVAGLLAGYTWPGFGAMAGHGVDPDAPPEWVMPAVEYNLFWTGLNYKARDSSYGTGTTLTSNVNLITLSVDPMIKFRLGPFHPYIGCGIGGTYLNAGNGKVTVPNYPTVALSGSSDDVDFSVAPFFGAELFLAPQWALTAEYKYLYLVDPKLSGGGTINYHSDGLGIQLVTAGLKFFF